jgi:copper chaperone CopZ
MSQVTLHIEGMSCGHCLKAVNQALNSVPGARVVSVQIGRAVVETAPDGPSADQLVAAVDEAGYDATPAIA